MIIFIDTLGCARNTVDSEILAGQLETAGHTLTDIPEEAETIIVNTCGFVTDAVEESIDAILSLAGFKETGACRQLIVCGCLPERFQGDLVAELPEVDLFLGTGAYPDIVSAIGKADHAGNRFPDPRNNPLQTAQTPRIVSTGHIAYVKVAEGCNKRCTYCIIPKLRGNQRSRDIDDIVMEAHELIAADVRELILVAQDTTFYGRDLLSPLTLSSLVLQLADLSPEVWIRILYGNPDTIEDTLIMSVASRPNICKYFDLPIQHASDAILKKMGRSYNQAFLRSLFSKIRHLIPEAVLRTTVIVGFPGETEEDFQTLLDFVKEIKFEHLGAFIYSDGEDLPSHHLPDHVPSEVALERQAILMETQAGISFEKNQSRLDSRVTVMVDGERGEDGLYPGHAIFQAPEVDGITYVDTEKELSPGDVLDVMISDTFDYDLIGDAV